MKNSVEMATQNFFTEGIIENIQRQKSTIETIAFLVNKCKNNYFDSYFRCLSKEILIGLNRYQIF